ncbi:Irs4 protein [Candida orthopsilosis Co 90-125]|uniref:Irs4 protein n=1 Tax=Candida orthopsilosis (strain 90-125) TaxID=1136231 RepID=H8X2Q0_CANO9|nr:Irs4 protein [Candida orthopsilosis Co 90-125]CCG25597.1 Irs4 protein [Candida orthopsilosis Co 90-125]
MIFRAGDFEKKINTTSAILCIYSSMSNANNAANIAALAAFNAGKKKDVGNAATTTSRLSGSQSQNKSQTHMQQPQPKRNTTQKNITTKKPENTSTDASSQASLQPAYSPIQRPQSHDFALDNKDRASSGHHMPDYFTQTPRQVSRRHSAKSPHYSPMLSPQSPRDMISSVRSSIDSKAINNDANSKRLSLDYSPQEMLKTLKESLNRKSQAQNIPKMMDARGQTILDGVRERIDDNMKETSHNLANLSLKQYEWSKSHSDAELGNTRGVNDSQSSFETCMTDVDPRMNLKRQSTPNNAHGVRIDVTDHDAEVSKGQSETNDAAIRVPVPAPESDALSVADTFHSPSTNKGARRKPPPPSDEESDTIARHTTSDTDNNDDMHFNSSDGLSGDELRKQMQLNGVSMDTFSSGEVMIPPDDMASFTDNEESDPPREIKVKDTKFPQFPDVRKHHQHLFGMRRHRLKEGDKYHRYDSGANSDDELSESSSQLTAAAPLPQQQIQVQGHANTSKGSSQPVKFKATMRKTNKRKDRKTKFDELKPWKTHDELNFPTEHERKRYEGVWVSNKGLYMNLVVTRLTGVDYDRVDGEKPTAEHDDSMKAALISTNVIQPDAKDDGSDKNDSKKGSLEDEAPLSKAEEAANKLHSLENADPNQLILSAVVKRIWNRSRLPSDILEQIWNLVDFRRDGSLNKNEFLVGMWLVDQCLYGRKLPKKVESIVWDSLGGIGVNVNLNSRRWK